MSQFLYNQDAVTSFATSSTAPIVRMGIAAAGKMAISPTMENHPATAETDSADNTNRDKNIIGISSFLIPSVSVRSLRPFH